MYVYTYIRTLLERQRSNPPSRRKAVGELGEALYVGNRFSFFFFLSFFSVLYTDNVASLAHDFLNSAFGTHFCRPLTTDTELSYASLRPQPTLTRWGWQGEVDPRGRVLAAIKTIYHPSIILQKLSPPHMAQLYCKLTTNKHTHTHTKKNCFWFTRRTFAHPPSFCLKWLVAWAR